MKKMINEAFVAGYLYDNTLEMKKVENKDSKNFGKTFIRGDVIIATDDNFTNTVNVKYIYVTDTYGKDNKPNPNFNILKNIIDGRIASYMNADKEHCAKVQIRSAVGLNEFPDSRSGEWVSVKVLNGGFISTLSELPDEKQRNNFNCDFVITGTKLQEENEERGLPEKMILRGCIFDFKNSLMPVEFSVLNPKAIDYFNSLDISKKNPCFTRVQGNMISQTVVRKVEEESAFGEPVVRESKSSYKDFVVNWALAEPYEFDSEDSITAQELSEAIQNREIYLAEQKKRNEDFQKSRNNSVKIESNTDAFDF